jgi:hypothetical protein
MKRFFCTMISVSLLVGFARGGLASELSDPEAVEAAQESLDGRISFPWYDASSDGIRRVDVAPPADLKNRESKWERTPKKRNRAPWQWPPGLTKFLRVLGWTVVVILLILVGFLLVRAFLASESRSALISSAAEDIGGTGDADRVESLPFQIKRPQSDLLSEARKHYEAGNYAEAIIYLYSYQLVELDKRQFIRLTKGKTNRQYLREVRRRAAIFDLLRVTMFAFEDVFFGNHSLERGRFESCWNKLDAFHQSLEATA